MTLIAEPHRISRGPGPASGRVAALALVVELLEQSRDLGRVLEQVRQLVDHQERVRRTGGHIKGVGQDVTPVGQAQAPGPQAGMGGDRVAEPLDRGQPAFLPHGGDVQAADLLGQSLQKVRLPMPPPPGHDTEPHRGIRIGEEIREQIPLPVSVDHVVRFGRQPLLHSSSCSSTATECV